MSILARARSLPPRVVLEKAARIARDRILGPILLRRAPVDAPGVETVLDVLGGGAQAEVTLAATRGPLPHAAARGIEIAGVLAARFPEAADVCLSRASWVAENPFRIPGAIDGVELGWHHDPRSGHRWETGVHHRAIQLFAGNGADPKGAWEVGRFYQAGLLGRAHVLSLAGLGTQRAPAFAHALAAQIEDFIRDCPPGRGIQWACPMDAAIRACNLLLGTSM